MPDKDQVFIFNKNELSLIKNTFAENEELLYAIRKVLLQFPLTDGDRALIKAGVTPEVFAVLKKRILPDIGPEYPLGQLPSILTTLTNDIRVKDVDAMSYQFESKRLQIAYLAQQFDVLAEVAGLSNAKLTVDPIKLQDLSVITNPEDTFINMTAYLFLLGYIDPSLIMIRSIAGAKDETPEQQTERMRRDSNK